MPGKGGKLTETVIRYTPETLHRFWCKVNIDDLCGCWEWRRSRDPDGYGQFWANGIGIRAHRFAWMIVNGDIPAGKCILHKCDNPPCVNPAHLYVGTNQDNVRDRDSRDRHAHQKGSAHGQAKLTEEDVARIHELKQTGMLGKDIAALYGVSSSSICDINTGRKWGHIPRQTEWRDGRKKLDEQKVAEIIELLNQGKPHRQIAKTYGVTKSSITCINRNVTWRHVNRTMK